MGSGRNGNLQSGGGRVDTIAVSEHKRKDPAMIDEAPRIQHRPVLRPAAALVDALRGTSTGFIVEALGGSGALDYRIKAAVAEQAACCGVALTCDAGPADNLALVAALPMVQPGDVLVAATGNYTGCAITGDLVLGMARNSGAVGFVTDGCVRDLPGIRTVGLPCFCVGVTPNSPARSGPGTVGFPVTIAGQPVASGDVIVADQDGVVVVPQARLEELIARLPTIRKSEAELDEAVRNGMRVPPFLAKD
jgi:4-hydroxy-4-methyl-2-oxoglutarate aldolase